MRERQRKVRVKEREGQRKKSLLEKDRNRGRYERKIGKTETGEESERHRERDG